MGYPKPSSVLAATHDHLGKQRAAAERKQFDVEDLELRCSALRTEQVSNWKPVGMGFKRMKLILARAYWAPKEAVIGQAPKARAQSLPGKMVLLENKPWRKPLPGPTSVMKHFADAILNDEPHMCTGEEGLALMQLLDGIYHSAKTGREFRFAD